MRASATPPPPCSPLPATTSRPRRTSPISATRADAANPDCSTLQKPVYLQVGDTQTNLMKNLGRALRDNAASPVTLVFMTNGSCTNIDLMYHKTGSMSGTGPFFIPSTAE